MKVLSFILSTFLLATSAHAKYGGGIGAPNDPYQIATAEDLMLLGESPEDYGKHFILTADIDLAPNLPNQRVFDRAIVAPDTDGEKYGFQGTPFTGVFDGNGHTISHLTIKGVYHLGLFGQLGPGGRILNLGLEAVDVNGIWDRVGGLVGLNKGSITASYSVGVINGNYGIGGLVGYNMGSITNCHSTGNVSGRVWVGGLVGDNFGTITNCHSPGNASGDGSIGGLVGRNLYGSVVRASYSNGAVNGNNDIGGLVGSNRGNIAASYSTGAVTGDEDVGGLVGSNHNGSITQSYSSGTVDGTGTYVGGLVGFSSSPTVSAGVWDTEASGLSGSASGVGLTTAEMMDPYMLGLNGFADDPNWVLDAGRDYPRLAWEGMVGSLVLKPDIDWLDGSGTAEAPYRVDTAERLILLGKAPIIWDKHFVLSADIDLDPALPGRRVFAQPPIQYFTGVFDGNSHIISHLIIAGAGHLGLFGRLASGAEVKDLGVVDVKVTGTDSCGGLVGNNGGDLSHCYSNGVVTGDSGVGGLAGYNEGSITASYSSGTVNGDEHVGGLVGSNGGNITTSYSTGAVQGDERVGGLVGFNSGRVRGCDSSGEVDGGNNVGGIVGYNNYHGNVTHCASTGAIDGSSSVGGLVGYNHFSADVTCCYSTGAINGTNKTGGLMGANRGTTSNCYATGPTTGNELIGGLVGHNYGTITKCYSAGMVTGISSVGGLIGSNDGQITHSFWDIRRSGQTTSAGGTGRTTTQMQTAEIFLGVGWDFVGESENGKEDIWMIPEGQGYPELAWNFWAASPHPKEDATDVFQPLILTWVVGKYPIHHNVYFGEDEETVANATTESPDVYRGRQSIEMATYDPGLLEYGKTYYWRIDEVNEANMHNPWKGKVWNFTTADFVFVLVVDDFEIYGDNDVGGHPAIWQVWIDGWGDPDNGSQVGYVMPPYTEKVIVHGGYQSMPLFYDNTGHTTISEAVRTFDSPWDWTINDADSLTLYFRGEADNDPETLYVAVEDRTGRMAVATHPAPDALLTTEWQKWHVSLVDMQAAGVDLTAVLKISIGVGDRDNPQPGSSGKIYIDDIWITNGMP